MFPLRIINDSTIVHLFPTQMEGLQGWDLYFHKYLLTCNAITTKTILSLLLHWEEKCKKNNEKNPHLQNVYVVLTADLISVGI